MPIRSAPTMRITAAEYAAALHMGDMTLNEKDLRLITKKLLDSRNLQKTKVRGSKKVKFKKKSSSSEYKEEIKKLKQKLDRATKTKIKLRTEKKTLQKKVEELEEENKELKKYHNSRFDLLDL